jgi:hypothetical protein
MQTVTADNTDSILKYGVWEKLLSAGTTKDQTEAEWVRDSHLAEAAWPATSKVFSTQGGSVGIRLSCLGFIHFLKNWIVTQKTPSTHNVETVIYNISTNPTDSKMLVVLNLDPNSLLDNTYAVWDFEDNDVDVWLWEDQSTDAYTLVRSMVERGDGAGNRSVFGVYADNDGTLIIRYGTIPTAIEYYQALRSPGQEIRKAQGSEIDNWAVLPNKWLLFGDFMIGRPIETPPNPDPRTMYIERVAYSTPNGLQLEGGKVERLKQMLADFGIGI